MQIFTLQSARQSTRRALLNGLDVTDVAVGLSQIVVSDRTLKLPNAFSSTDSSSKYDSSTRHSAVAGLSAKKSKRKTSSNSSPCTTAARVNSHDQAKIYPCILQLVKLEDFQLSS